MKPGQSLFIDDGTLHLTVEKVSGKDMICRVIVGGKLGERKGVSLPGAKTSLPILTAGDIDDLKWAIDKKMDLVALSFVRNRLTLWKFGVSLRILKGASA